MLAHVTFFSPSIILVIAAVAVFTLFVDATFDFDDLSTGFTAVDTVNVPITFATDPEVGFLLFKAAVTVAVAVVIAVLTAFFRVRLGIRCNWTSAAVEAAAPRPFLANFTDSFLPLASADCGVEETAAIMTPFPFTAVSGVTTIIAD